MVAGDIILNPTKIKVTGAKSVVDDIKSASIKVNLNGEKSTFEKKYSANLFDEKGELLSGLDVSPREILANVSIIKGSNTKTVPIKPKITGAPKDGYIVESITIEPNLIDITASTKNLSEIKMIETENIDITGMSENFDKDIKFGIPKDVSVINKTSNVKVHITFQQISISRSLSMTNFKILNSTIQAESFDPSSIVLDVYGSIESINKISSNDIVVSVDLKDKIAQNGIIEAIINQSNISVPDGIILQNYTPQTLKIKIK